MADRSEVKVKENLCWRSKGKGVGSEWLMDEEDRCVLG